MLDRIITWSLEHRLLVVVLALVLLATGIEALFRLPIDAFPDTTPVQVQVNTIAPALSPLEIEQQVTFAVEQVIAGLAGLAEVRSISKAGLSQVTVLFQDGTNIYLARQQVMERLQTAVLPENVARPELGPVATGLGEVFHYLVTGSDQTLEELTTIHDWVIKPRLRSVPGVAEINTWGGEIKQYHVLVDLTRLLGYGLTLDDVAAALRDNNLTVGGGHITQAGERHLVRGLGLVTNLEDIAGIAIGAHDGVPIRIADIGQVAIGHGLRRGAATANGKGEVVLGLGFMLMGENSREVTNRLKKRLDEIRTTLPPGVSVQPVYERTALVDQVIVTVRENLFEGAILVVAVLFIFLGNFRAGLIVASAIPLSMLFAFNGMLRFGIAGSLMSLGAIDFGLIVDSSVIMIENSVRQLGANPDGRSVKEAVRTASIEVRKPTMYGELMIMIVYLPILTLEGIEGKLFRPMALTVIFALLGSLILSLTLMPVLSSLLLKPRREQREALVMRVAKRCYLPLLRLAMRARMAFLITTVALLIGGLWLASRTGTEFVPRLSEMGIVINTVRLAGVSLEESVRYGTQMERLILEKFPDEVRDVWIRTGTAEVATDPMGIELSDVFLTLTPRREWRRAGNQEQLTEALRQELSGLPGMRMVFSQPIEMRVNEMVAGIRAGVGIKILGDDLEKLKELATQVADILTSVTGSVDVYAEQLIGQPMLEVAVDPQAIARHGISARTVLDLIEAIGPRKVGEIREGQRRFDLAIRLDETSRDDITSISRLVVPTPDGGRIPLARLAEIRQTEGPATITREWQKRRLVVQCNVRGRDIGSFVAEARKRLAAELALPADYEIRFGGQYEHLARARARLFVVVPLALALILLLLYAATRSVRDTAIIFSGAPFAALGGIVALWLRDMPFTISAAVGFIAVSGVAMLNGMVLVATIKQLQSRGADLWEAIEQGALMRLRPVLMTALVAGLGFVPMALNTGVGAEVQRPLATVVIGGVISDNLLTLLILPILYAGTAGRATRRG